MWKRLFRQPLPLPLTKNEKTTLDLKQYEIFYLLQSKNVNKDTKWQKRQKVGNIKQTNKRREDKIISTLHKFICPYKNTMASVDL